MNRKWTQTLKFVLAGLLICSQNPLYSQSGQTGIVPGPRPNNGGSVYGNVVENAINRVGNAVGQSTEAFTEGRARAARPLGPTEAPGRRASWGMQQDAGNVAQQTHGNLQQVQNELIQAQEELQRLREQANNPTTAPRGAEQLGQGSGTREEFETAPGANYQAGEYGSQFGGEQVDQYMGGQAGNEYGDSAVVTDGSYSTGTTNLGPNNIVPQGNVPQNFNAGVAQPYFGEVQNGQAYVDGGFVDGPIANDSFIAGSAIGNVGQSFFAAGRAGHTRLRNVFNRALNPRGAAINRVFGIGAIGLGGRDFDEDNVVLAGDTLVPSRVLGTEDASIDDFGGIEATFQQRNEFGKGIEARYFGLFENDATAVLPRQQNSSRLIGLGNVVTSIGTGQQLYSRDGTQSVSRTNRINNFEVNRLKHGGGKFLGMRTSMCEHYYGFRLFNFDETLNYRNSFASPIGNASAINYRVRTDNQLAGLQTGQRAEIPLRGRFGMSIGGRFGAFNNRVRTRQYFSTLDASGNTIEIANMSRGTGGAFDLSDEKDNIAFLGEFNFGLTYQVRQNSRARIGYRALGVSRLALADRQIPSSFYRPESATFADTDGDMILQGGYFGLEFVR